jgi:integrase
MRKRITTALVEKVKPIGARYEVWDDLVPGFGLRVGEKGAKSYVLMYRVKGDRRQRRATLGRAGIEDLAEMREKAREYLKVAGRGKDPLQAEADAKAERKVTFGELAEQYIERWAKPRKRTWAEDEATLARDVLPKWKHRTAAEITRRDVLALLEAKARVAPVRVNRTLALLRKLYGWAVDVDIVPASPVTGIKALGKESQRDRVLSDAELAAFWRATGAMPWPWGSYFRTLSLTAQRRDEVASMRWADVDLGATLWRLPAASTKAARAHDVPLAPAVVDILGEAPRFSATKDTPKAGTYVFTSGDGTRPISGYSKAKARLDELMLAELRKAAEEKAKATGQEPREVALEPWRLHDLRRSAASAMARMGTGPHILGAVLNHSAGSTQGVTAIYNRHRYGDEKCAALAAWATYLTGLVEERPNNVVPIAAGA